MATLMSSILTQARSHLNETTAVYWTDDELLLIANNGITDLWRRINDLYQHYFITIDITNMSLAASSSSITGVPTDVFRIVSIEPRVVGQQNPNPGLIFVPADYNDPRFVSARARGPVEPKNVVLYYDVMNPGAPVGAPTIRVAPQISSAANLAVAYNQVLSAVVAASNNPIPGGSDNALIAWIVAYARAKEREDRAPDAEWLAVYATDKAALCRELTPRQIQEPEVVQGVFEEDDWGWGF
jgi:hypothetical protein